MEPPFFTLNACNRCRRRKGRCDTGLPACKPCRASGSACEYTDPRSKKTHPREFVRVLEAQLAQLEKEVAKCAREASAVSAQRSPASNPSGPAARACFQDEDQDHPDLIKLVTGGDAHFLGVSSGMHMARSVLQCAQRNNVQLASHPNESEQQALPSPSRSPPPHKSPEPALPSRETAINLIDVFFKQYQVQYPILMRQEFMPLVSTFYESGNQAHGRDARTRFMLCMTFASALVSLSQENHGALALAQSLSSNAMADFYFIVKTKSLQTLQCLLLLLLHSILSPSSAPVWHISGLCTRMCVDLGLHSEATIALAGSGQATYEEMDAKRRLFWVTYTFDRMLSTTLGRPFTLDDATINVEFPQFPAEPKGAQIIHWLRLQRLQSEIVLRLYVNRGEGVETRAELAAWVAAMDQRLGEWIDAAMPLADSGPAPDWWRYWYQNTRLILHRPSPANSQPEGHIMVKCYDAAKSLVQLAFIHARKGLVDVTWLELHHQVMGGITLLFLVWNIPEIQAIAKDDWLTFKSCLCQWESILHHLAARWGRMARPMNMLIRLADATVDALEVGDAKSFEQTNRRRQQKRTRDQDQRRSIMQQLGSSKLCSGSSASTCDVQPPHAHSQDAMAPEHALYDAPSGTAIKLGGFHHPGLGAFDVSNASEQPVHPASQYSWQNPQPQQQMQGLATDWQAFGPDASAMFREEVWPNLNGWDNSEIYGGLGFLDYLPLGMAGGQDVTMSGTERMEGINIDSILNFREV